MDVYCPICGEPWDIGEFHYSSMSFDDAWKFFRRVGCAVFGTKCSTSKNEKAADAMKALYDAMPDDPDGVAGMLEDFLG